MKVVEFKYFSKDDECDTKRLAWSRIYEYDWVLKQLLSLWIKEPLIHNSWCWGWTIHLEFAQELENYWTIINTDNDNWQWSKVPNNFLKYDILKSCNFEADIVLCISTLEHLSDQVLALSNLIEATKEWGYIIVTLDSPPVNIEAIENFLWVKCEWVETKLNQWNSKIRNPAFTDELNVVRLVIQK